MYRLHAVLCSNKRQEVFFRYQATSLLKQTAKNLFCELQYYILSCVKFAYIEEYYPDTIVQEFFPECRAILFSAQLACLGSLGLNNYAWIAGKNYQLFGQV